METQKTVSEGAGATSVAAAMFGKVDTSSKKTVCLVSGGNIDVSILSRVITKGLTKTGRITEITTKVTDKPGQLTSLLQHVAQTGANIVSVNHDREDRKSEINSCVVSMVLETRNPGHVEEIHKALRGAGYIILDD
jgi:threonine dehydratase